MPLILEIWNDATDLWERVNDLIPGDPEASLSNNTVLGRDLYQLLCDIDDSKSTIFKSAGGVDSELPGGLRAVVSEYRIPVKELKDGEEFEMRLMTDNMIAPHRFRFRHVKLDFGTRHCLICEKEIPAQRFGTHVLAEHSPEELAEWPGGAAEILPHLRRSLNESIKRAKEFPRYQQQLKASLKALNQLEKRMKADWN